MSNSALLNQDALVRSLQDILGELADKMGNLHPECRDCPVHTSSCCDKLDDGVFDEPAEECV